MQPLVSVIMPAYNAEKYIGEAIQSILDQTYKSLELIVVEDCSVDNTLEKIYFFQDERVRLFINDKNRGISYSTNFGLEQSKGKYIALLDDDDLAFPDRLQLQVNYMEKHPEIDILGGMMEIIDGKGKHCQIGGIPRNNPKYIKAMLLFHNAGFGNGTAMIRKSFIEKYNLRYQDNCLGMQDYKFYIDSSKCGNISTIDRLLLKCRIHEENETKRRKEKQGEDRTKLYAKFQRDSLKTSGFNLSEKYLSVINKILGETIQSCDNKKELLLLRDALCEILKQGKEMDIDYYKELEIVCKKELVSAMMKLRMEDWM